METQTRLPLLPRLSATLVLMITVFTACSQPKNRIVKTQTVDIVLDTVAKGITIPFGMAFLPDGHLLVTDRGEGRIWKVDPQRKTKTALANVPAVHDKDQAGMLDIILHPDYANNGWVYYSFSMKDGDLNGTAVERARIRRDSLVDRQRLFTTHPFFKNGAHYGSRFAFHDGHLYFTIGERYALRDSSQLLGNHLGKVIRLRDDGGVPADNPFVGKPGARPEITYGVEYSGATIGDGITQKEGMEQPVKYYKPSIGPSGLVIYNGDRFPTWKGNFFTGALALTHLNRLVVAEGKVVKEERLLSDRKWRVRNVVQGPDGYLYIGVDGGMVLRIRPAR
jgi:glucose/arabinose dehydrogenase